MWNVNYIRQRVLTYLFKKRNGVRVDKFIVDFKMNEDTARIVLSELDQNKEIAIKNKAIYITDKGVAAKSNKHYSKAFWSGPYLVLKIFIVLVGLFISILTIKNYLSKADEAELDKVKERLKNIEEIQNHKLN